MQLAASKPQTPVLFLQEALVPEAACLLAQEDLEQSKGYSIDIQEVYNGLEGSREYGSYVYPAK